MPRLRYNGLSATLGGSGLTSSGTTITFTAALTHSGGTAVPTISGDNHIPLSLFDSNGVLKEVVYLTAYTSGATTGTIVRGQDSTTGVAHASGVKVANAPLVADVGSPSLLLDYGGTPAANTPYGTIVYEQSPPATTWSFASSLPSGWTMRGTVTSVSHDSTGMTGTFDAGEGYSATIPVASSDCILETKFASGSASSVMMGAMLADSTGKGAAAVYYSSPTGVLAAQISGWQYNSTFESVTATATFPVWFRLRYQHSTGRFYASRSTDGINYTAETLHVVGPAGVAAPSLVSFGSIFSSVTAKVEYVKFYAGTRFGGLRGWWDGSQIVSF